MNRQVLPIAASVSYAANVALGVAVATRVVSTKKVRWVHHALFVTTATLTAAAAVAAIVDRRSTSAVALVGALGILSAAPFVDTHSWRHGATAGTAAPFFVATLIGTRRHHGVS